MTYYDQAMPVSVFVNETLPAYAIVRLSLLPDYDRLAELQIQTTLESGLSVATFNTPVSLAFLPPDTRIAAIRGAKVTALVDMHQRRVAAESVSSEPVKHHGLEYLKGELLTTLQKLRAQLRERGWLVPTADPSLDRYSLRGAFALTHYSTRAIGARTGNPKVVAQPANATDRQLRIDADMVSIQMLVENPQVAPGRPWPLITVVIATALLSFVAMSTLWNSYGPATLVLAAVAFHEGGHAIAMRSFGYRDVHVFFVPLLGAMRHDGRTSDGRQRPGSDRHAPRRPDSRIMVRPGVVHTRAALVSQHTVAESSARILLARAVLNGLNLLPFTPLDGGRALEVLTRPEECLAAHRTHRERAGGLRLTLALFLRDPFITALGAFWLAMAPRQWQAWQLRRQVAAAAHNAARDFRDIARITLEVMAARSSYASRDPGRGK